MCNKILWLDHGKQIAFTDEKDLYLDAYEEFLKTKHLPENREDVEEMAARWQERKRKERERAERTETQKLEAILDAGESESAIQAAVNILRKNRPELLK